MRPYSLTPLLAAGIVLSGCATSTPPLPEDDAAYVAKVNALVAQSAEMDAVWRTILDDPEFAAVAKQLHEAEKAGATVRKCRLLQKIEPVYPAWKRTTRTEFRTFTALLVDANGRVAKTKFVPMKGWEMDSEFGDSIENATRDWRYAPATIDGANAASIVTMPMIFSLQGRATR